MITSGCETSRTVFSLSVVVVRISERAEPEEVLLPPTIPSLGAELSRGECSPESLCCYMIKNNVYFSMATLKSLNYIAHQAYDSRE